MIFVDGLGAPEAPVCLKDGSWLVVEMSGDRGCITHISSDGQSRRVVATTGCPNGLALDRHGCIWVAESGNPSLIRASMGGETEIFATECAGERFLFPNDLAFGPDGALYMSDSGIVRSEWVLSDAIRTDYLEVGLDGRLYKIDVRTGAVTKLDSGLRFANGLAFASNGDLYVNETVTGTVYRYPWRHGEIARERQEFGNVSSPMFSAGMGGADGMKFDVRGNLYVAVHGQGNVAVLAPSGEVVRRIKTHGTMPTNVAFGLPGTRRVFVTECELGTLESHQVGADGLPLHL